ncbi:calcium ATPase [Gonapodya prolifera JEL478]|uniref:Calcium ATPase n=1 Tax=Gonapodya prolifera (strain JEL478) TaxID=1344416 RepID=A0A139AI48_GONPJ|nr:calcium ATPase [Gonapodya prolifera JEL478]|eukprot:KXS16491.1 calcium ATPase [Gonapodya prolifera JEL478]
MNGHAHSKTDGLTSTEAAERLKSYGPNDLDDPKLQRTFLAVVWEEVQEPMMVLLLILGTLYSLWGNVVDTLTIFVTVCLLVSVEVVTEYNAKSSLDKLHGSIAHNIAVLRDKKLTILRSDYLVPGDIFFLSRGQKLPCDAQVVESVGLAVDESLLSGESSAVSKFVPVAGSSEDKEAEVDQCYAMTNVVSGRGTFLATNTGLTTRYAHLRALSHKRFRQKDRKTPIQKLMKRVTYILTWNAAAVSLLVLLLSYFVVGTTWQASILTAMSLAFATIPEELPLIVKAVMAVGARKMADHGALVRRLRAADSLGAVEVLVTDKTGTLTRGIGMDLRSAVLIAAGDFVGAHDAATAAAQTNGVANPNPIKAIYPASTTPLVPSDVERIALFLSTWALSTGLLDATAGDSHSLHEMDVFDAAILAYLDTDSGRLPVYRDALASAIAEFPKPVAEMPFNPTTRISGRCRSARTEQAVRVAVVLKGSPETVIAHCTRAIGPRKAGASPGATPDTVELTSEARAAALGFFHEAANTGQVIAYAMRTFEVPDEPASDDAGLFESKDCTFVGGFLFHDPVLPSAADTVAKLREAGVRVVMATGDGEGTAVAVASETGILLGPAVTGTVVSGQELARVLADAATAEDKDFKDELAAVYYRASPENKYDLVTALQKAGHVVGMVGDGANDGPALAQADVGVAVGGGTNRTDVAMDSASLVLLSPEGGIAGLVDCIQEGRRMHDNVRKTVIFYLGCKSAIIILFIVALVTIRKLPLNPVHVVILEMFMDVGASATFPVEPAEGHVLRRPPSKSTDGVFGWHAILTMVYACLALFGVVGGAFVAGLLALEHDPSADPRLPVSMAFMAWLIGHVVLGLSCRTQVEPLRIHGYFTNRRFGLWAVAVFGSGVTVTVIPGVHDALGLAELSWAWIGIIWAVALVLILVPGEVSKEILWRKMQGPVVRANGGPNRGENGGHHVDERTPLLA